MANAKRNITSSLSASPVAVSVAMSVYNGADFLPAAIESILAQTMQHFEYIILNDGSSDATRSIIDSYAARDNRIRPIHRENKGLITSLNELIKESKAPYIARMDADDISKPDRFEKQLMFLKDNQDHGVLGTWSEDINEAGERIYLDGGDQPVSHEDIIAEIQNQNCLCHPSVMMKRDLVQSVGGYHAAFKHCEDYDLWLRLSDKTKIANLPERLIQYRQSSGQITQQHLSALAYGSIVALLAYQRRASGRYDPTQNISQLPECEGLDELFDQPALSQHVYRELFQRISYSKSAMQGELFPKLLDYVKHGGSKEGHWRTVARLAVRMHEPGRAFKLAKALAGPKHAA